MTAQPDVSPTSDERMLGAVSHFFGLVVALIIFATQKDKSRFVRFQAAQAVAFDVIVFIVVFVLVGCVILLSFLGAGLGTAGMAAAGDDSGGALFSLLFALPFLGNCFVILVALGLVALRIIAAVNVFQGRNYHHPWLGARVEKMLG